MRSPAPASFHLYLPQMRMSHEEIVRRAVAAEAAGFEGLAFMDHLAPPAAVDQGMWEAISLAAWVLGHTTTLTVGHLVLCDALRHPAVLARQVTSLDHASGGRFELGIGSGSVPAELATFGFSTSSASERVGRLGETLEILRALWTGEVVDYDGEHFTLVGAQQRPVPTRPIPITIGGVGSRTMALVRQHADWWNVPVHMLDRFEAARGQAGGARISMQLMLTLLRSDSERNEVTSLMERRFGGTAMGSAMLVGTASELVTRLAKYVEQGVERFYVWFGDFAPVETLAGFSEVISAYSSS